MPSKSHLAGCLCRLEDVIRLQNLLVVVLEREAEVMLGRGKTHTVGDLVPATVLGDHFRAA